MKKVGTGLLHKELLSCVQERWDDGGIAIIYVKLLMPGPDLQETLAMWERDGPDIFWKQQLESGNLYWLHRPSSEASIALVAKQSARQIQTLLDQSGVASADDGTDLGKPFRIGVSLVAPPESPMSAEEMLLRQVSAAMEFKQNGSTVDEPSAWEPKGRYSVTASGGYTIGMLSSAVSVFETNAKVSDIAYMFDTNPTAPGAVIVRERRPVGLIMKEKLHQLLAGQFGFALYFNRSVERLMEREPLIVDESTPVELVSQLAMSRNYSQLYDMVITVKQGLLTGATSIRSILECMTALRTEEARTASPLTGLPGNAGIQAELLRKMSYRRPFAVVYADLDYFKWFNDCFGFARGDELIRFLADLLVTEFAECGDDDCFVGHIGGDDFIAVADPACAEATCRRLVALFDQGVRSFYGETDVTSVTNREGETVEQNGVTLSLSLLNCDGQGELDFEDISVFAARLKKQAKAFKGSVFVSGQLKGRQPREK